VAALRPDWEGVHQAISHLYLSKGQMEKAVLELEQELRIAPHDEVVRMELEAQKKRLTQSRGQTAGTSSSTQTKDTDPSSITSPDSGFTLKGPLSLTSRGIERFRARDLKNAKEALSRVLQGDPRNSEVLLYLARTHYALREFEESIQVLQARKPAAGHDLEMLYWLGKSYQELAASTLQKMIDIDPFSYRVHQMSGELFEEKTQYADALSAYQKVMKQSPDLAGIRYAIGNVYWKMQELDEALNWFKEELARNPYHALANYKVGNTYMLKGSPESAIPYLEKAVQANPGMLVAQQELAKSLLGQGRVEDAITRFKIVARADPQDESVHYLLSTAYKKLGRLEEANAELKLFSQLQQKKAEQDRKYLERRVSRDAESSPNQKRSLSSTP
jgi:tetratricopeptide (TPR) repeat protein